MSETRKLIESQVQAQLEQAVDCVNSRQYGAAQIHFLECSTLCQQLEIERQLEKQQPRETQLTIDVKTNE